MARETKDLFRALPPRAQILLVRLRSMGDCLLLTGPLKALRREFPLFRISVLVESRFSGCFDGNPDVDEVLTTEPTKYATLTRLFRRRFDAIVNLHGGPTSLLYCLSAKGLRIGIKHYPHGFFYSGLTPSVGEGRHTVEATMDCFRWMGVREPKAPTLHYAPHRREAEWVRKTLGERPYVVIHPAALMDTKRWPTKGFSEVARILNDDGWCAVFTAGPGEEVVAGRAATELKESVVLLGLTIPQLAELIRGAALYLGNDAGPTHLAAAVGTPTVVVWGSSDSSRWYPWAVPHRVVQNAFDCNPCPGYRCLVAETPLCIESVRVDQVVEAVQSLIAETGRFKPLPATL